MKRKTWLKLGVRVAVIVVAVVGIIAWVNWHRLRGRPDWYLPDTSTAEQRQASEHEADAALIRLQDRVSARAAAHYRARGATPSTKPLEPFQLDLTDTQLNAFFNKWAEYKDRRAAMAAYVEDPRLVVQDGQVIVVGNVKELGLIVSLIFEPHIDAAGNLQLKLAKVMGGTVTLPEMMWAGQRQRLERVLEADLPGYQRDARIDSDGIANAAAASAGMNEMLLAMIRGRSSEPVVFIPADLRSIAQTLPLRVTAVTADHHMLKMTASEMTPAQRDAFLQAIKSADPVTSGTP